ncbi:MAG: family 16 glycosylhydrolase [Haliscomenobacter sp.]|nr:family 16 glycosylhydrolase [Haliscomenobacter sp.]MBK7475974.1 family 16 glycosylhydrolase [Haliscomenobacter sp.]MBK8877932.1 family 16 glycosylhydrolase [Haliscomenobacter sp.]
MLFKQKWFSGLFLLFLGFAPLMSCSDSGGGNGTPTDETLPVLSVLDATTARGKAASSLRFYVSVDKAWPKPVSVEYSLVNGTAISPRDFIAQAGTLTIPANQLSANIEVTIQGDEVDLRQPNLEFTVSLSNPNQCTLAKTSAKGVILTEDGTNLTTDTSGYRTPAAYPGYALVWSDEFSGNGLDLNVWTPEIGNGVGGWGNNELEYYTNTTKNVFLSNGNLIIEARKEAIGGFNYSSARLVTRAKKEFAFGRIDIRAKLPVAKGLWPALWMLGSNHASVGWPACGEIDIMELVGSSPNRVTGSVHWKSVGSVTSPKNNNITLPSGDFSQKFHVFSLIWEKDKMRFYMDDILYFTFVKADLGAANYPFNDPFFFIFNVAVGGNWPGPPDGNTPFPQRMFVDYVRVFQ